MCDKKTWVNGTKPERTLSRRLVIHTEGGNTSSGARKVVQQIKANEAQQEMSARGPSGR